MGVYYETIPSSLQQWILDQKMLWVATAPLSGAGHVNVSPKGGPYFGIVDERTFWYLDLTGSGNETLSHLHEPGNGRITIMFNAFEGPPKIVRLWGKGTALEAGTKEFEKFKDEHQVKLIPGARSIVVVDVHQVGSSCGFSVPFYDFVKHRTTLNDFFETKERKFLKGNEKESMPRYWAYKNQLSMDGLPGMKVGVKTARKEKIEPIKKMVGPYAPKHYNGTNGFGNKHIILVALLSFLLGMLVTLYVSSSRNIGLARNSTELRLDNLFKAVKSSAVRR